MAEQRNVAGELASVAADLRRHVRWAQARGETHAPLADPAASLLPVAAPAPAEAPPAPAPRVTAAPAAPNPGAIAATPPDLAAIRAEMGDCRRCKLCAGRRNLVFGAGNPRAEIVFVAEAPDPDEDGQGAPLAGKAGQLLSKMIEAMGYRPDEVYVCHVVKCRPPAGRNPEPEEIAACEPFLQAQLAAIRPKAIVALGQFAARTLLREAAPITELRGRWHAYRGIPLMPTFHPGYLLRSPAGKAGAWADLKAVLARLGRSPPGR